MRILVLAAGLVLASAFWAAAHEGHDDAPGSGAAASGAAGPVEVSEVARRNLGLEMAEAELRPVETTLTVIGEITAEPERSGTVSSRIEGRVTAIYAKAGQHVQRGQQLVEIESFQIGDPPPRVRYAAPIEGTVTDRHVVIGDYVERNGHLFELADLREVLAVGRVFEGQIDQVAVGQAVRVRVPSYPDKIFEGEVERLGGQLDPASRSLPIFVRVPNPDGKLRPNMRATLSLVTARADLALVVPKGAILGEFGNPFVFVQREDELDLFERHAVVTGISDDLYVEILDGVLPGDLVVTQGNYSLQYLPPVSEPSEEPEAAGVAEAAQVGQGWGPWGLGLAASAVSLGALMLLLRMRARTVREAN